MILLSFKGVVTVGVLIPFNPDGRTDLAGDGEEGQILSDKHKQILLEKVNFMSKIITDKDLTFIRRETPQKQESLKNSKEFVLKMSNRVNILYQILFDDKFKKTKKTAKTIAAALLYFISSGDFLSDTLPGLGYLDDAFVISFVWNKFSGSIKDYITQKQLDESFYI